ncbi:serine hydrolase domain-containing protein [Ruminococcus sp.]|uniref:serine hydrolase domain-containing protein n=1 Tax=Ruminococcus sp. TaxID=41978 RepID=UPI001B2A72E2|nr:serine hydrolase domain-containing protein [Ruminococcus sp.]MBO5557722.1 beta-lactamase family protein [Ruminococcus sp.]MBO6127774.1 beta-lactamase family protein [Pseudobutyrivibrio sp.]
MNIKTRAEKLIYQAAERGDIAGANILVLKNGREVLYTEGGLRDIENSVPMSRDTIFRLYSQTKPVTAAAAILMASRGDIDLAADIADYLPEFAEQFVIKDGEKKPVSRRITVRDLLNMTSGLPYPFEGHPSGEKSGEVFWKTTRSLYDGEPVTTKKFCEMAAEIPCMFEPGSEFQYGIGADLIGGLIERISGMTFGEYLRENLFEPLGMEDTDFYVPAEKQSRLAKVYDYSENGLKENKTDNLSMRYMREVKPAFESGGAGLCSTLDDYGKFASMLINGGEFEGKRIMPEYAVEYLTRGGILPEQRANLWFWWDWMRGYGYGNFMRICEDENNTTLFSSKGEYGWDGWLGTFFSNEPKYGLTFLLGVQQTGIGKAGTLTRKLKNLVMGEFV